MHASLARGPGSMDVIDLGDGRTVPGFVDAGFGRAMEAFKANYPLRHDLGSACVAYVGGRRMVDRLGGLADRRTRRVWNRDTAAVMFSCSKGVLAVWVYRLVEDGRVDLDAPIAHYWPAFGDRFAYLSNQMGGYGDPGARELTLALGRVVGA